jgi:mono/diheme cytochrome c family protein
MKNRHLKILIPALPILVFGCTSLLEMAPPVEGLTDGSRAYTAAQRASLENGRSLYVQDCAKCHSPVAVSSLTRADWEKVMPRMVQITALDSVAHQDLNNYIDAVLTKADAQR